jgi:predicted DNA-binding helix-hairpin-helix protein
METIEKLRILSADSRYDLACACGTLKDEHRRRGSDGKWLYPLALPQGGYTVLLKTLLSNACANDCMYCPLRAESNVRRCSLQPEEVVRAFLEYWQKRKVFGLFLSSAVMLSPDFTMEKLNSVARMLRHRHGFKGYIHLKIIPGASDAAIEEALSLSTSVSLNIETPGSRRFSILSRKKDFDRDIARPLKLLGRMTARGGRFSKVKCTTQFIVGASDESDSEIVNYMYSLYDKLNFRRIYFSAYQKGLGNEAIPGERRRLADPRETFVREHRLYQTDFLIRKYGFSRDEICFNSQGNLRFDKDPKEVWADLHPEFFPVRINKAEKEVLLRVPGLGPETVKKVLLLRRGKKILRIEDFGLKGKRLEKVRSYVICE